MHVHAVSQSSLLLSQDKAPVESSPFGTLPPKAPGHDASGDDNPFGTRKARSSFGRGFFKIKSNKRTASAPNLGMCGQNAISLILPESGKDQSLSLFIYLYISFSQKWRWMTWGEKLIKKCFHRLNSEVKIAWCGLSHSAPCSGCKLRGKTKARGSLWHHYKQLPIYSEIHPVLTLLMESVCSIGSAVWLPSHCVYFVSRSLICVSFCHSPVFSPLGCVWLCALLGFLKIVNEVPVHPP